jgi:addiction module HigA family antidote
MEKVMSKARPDYSPVSPGEIIAEEYLEPLGMSAYRLAKSLHVPVGRITAVIKGKRRVTADTALRLARFFNTTPQFWLNLQAHYELELAKLEIGSAINAEVVPFEAA